MSRRARCQALFRRRQGETLVELAVGSAMALLLILAVADLELWSWRYSGADEQRFVQQIEAATALDRFAGDVRRATGFTLAAQGAPSVTLALATGDVTYTFLPETAELVREEGGERRVLARQVASLSFYSEQNNHALRVVLRSHLTGGVTFRLESRAALRTGP
jgi:hypothetical protein